MKTQGGQKLSVFIGKGNLQPLKSSERNEKKNKVGNKSKFKKKTNEI